MKKKQNKIVVIATIFCILIVGIIGVLWVSELNKKQNKNDIVTKKEDKVDNKNEEETVLPIETQEIQGDFEIETPYCSLYFPEKWKSQVSIEKLEGEGYTVQFFGNIEEKGQQHLFDVIFGGTEGIQIGNLTMEDGTIIPVSIYSVEQQIDENWTEEERNIIYTMQEEINYIIEKIETLDNFQTIL